MKYWTGIGIRLIIGIIHTYIRKFVKTQFFFLRIRLAPTRIQRIFRLYPEIFENALQSGNIITRGEGRVVEETHLYRNVISGRITEETHNTAKKIRDVVILR